MNRSRCSGAPAVNATLRTEQRFDEQLFVFNKIENLSEFGMAAYGDNFCLKAVRADSGRSGKAARQWKESCFSGRLLVKHAFKAVESDTFTLQPFFKFSESQGAVDFLQTMACICFLPLAMQGPIKTTFAPSTELFLIMAAWASIGDATGSRLPVASGTYFLM